MHGMDIQTSKKKPHKLKKKYLNEFTNCYTDRCQSNLNQSELESKSIFSIQFFLSTILVKLSEAEVLLNHGVKLNWVRQWQFYRLVFNAAEGLPTSLSGDISMWAWRADDLRITRVLDRSASILKISSIKDEICSQKLFTGWRGRETAVSKRQRLSGLFVCVRERCV